MWEPRVGESQPKASPRDCEVHEAWDLPIIFCALCMSRHCMSAMASEEGSLCQPLPWIFGV